MTKEHIEKVIRSNKPGIAAHQLYKEFEKEVQEVIRKADDTCIAKQRQAAHNAECGMS